MQLAAMFEVAPNVSAFYPAPALSIAFIAVYGIRFLPAVFVAAVLGTFPYHGFWEYAPQEWWQCVRQAGVYGLAGYALTHAFKTNLPLSDERDVFQFLSVAAASTMLSGAVAVLIFWVFDFFPQHLLPEVFFSFWAGDGAGVVMAFPLLMALMKKPSAQSCIDCLKNLQIAYYLKTLLLPAVIAMFGFGFAAMSESTANFGYIILLPVVWLAATMGLLGGALSALSANVVAALVYNHTGNGQYPAVELQTLFAITSAIAIVVGVAFDQRRKFNDLLMAREKENARLSRLATIGELGTTIAHEISSPLQSASIHSQMALKRLQKTDEVSWEKLMQHQQGVQNAIDKATQIHKRIRNFAANHSREISSTSLNDAVSIAMDMLEQERKACGAKIKLRGFEKPILVRADHIELQQVLINLLKNSLEALANGASIQKEIELLAEHQSDKVVFQISDTGEGIPSDIIDRVFQSFITTKEQGLGMGLSLCRTMMEGFGGNIKCQNNEKCGTTFTLEFVRA